MSEFTGERFHPEMAGQIAFEHLHRYYLAAALCKRKRVLDVACGEGYGSAILAAHAEVVTGADIASEAVTHARERYARPNLAFVEASAAELPFGDASFDVVVSFETIEHHDRHKEMISEISRVLAPGGLLIISSPNKQYYSIETGYVNPFHVKELFRDEFVALVAGRFPHTRLLSQRVVHGSLVVPEDKPGAAFRSMRLKSDALEAQSGLGRPLYDILLASDGKLPSLHASLFEQDMYELDAATFYGVHLPERVAEGDNKVAQLEIALQEKPASEAALREMLDAGSARLSGLLSDTRESLLAALEASRAAVEEKDARLQEAAVAAAAAAAERDAVRASVASLERQLDASRVDFKTEIERREAALSAVQAEGDRRAAELAAAEAKCSQVASELERTSTRLEEARAAISERDDLLQAERASRLALEKRIEACERTVSEFERTVSEMEQAAAVRESRISELSERNKQLEEAVTQRELELVRTKQELEAEFTEARTVLAMRERDLLDRKQALEAELDQARQAVRRLESRVQDIRSLAESRGAELEEVLSSRSWRLTAPIRWARRGFSGSPFDLVKSGGAGASRVRPALEPAPAVASFPAAEAVQEEPAANDASAMAGMRDRYLERLFAQESDGVADDYVQRTDAPTPVAEELRAKLIAYYLPQFHPIPENDEWWGKGFTEWTNVTKAVPQFIGHHQPQLPTGLGFYDLRLADVIREQVALARQYGVHGFCFHYYWFAGKRLLEKPLDLFIENRDIDFPFCLCWANENWTRRWDGFDNEILIAQEHSPENDLAFIEDLAPYLRDERYIRIDGRPLVIVYRPSILPDCRGTLVRWREYCRENGIGEIFLAMVQFDAHDPRAYGFDAALEFPPHKLAAGLDAINGQLEIVNPDYRGHVVHYQSIVDRARTMPRPEYPLVRGVFPGWDNEARRPGKGYTFAFSTPERYQAWLEHAVEYAEANPVAGERIVMVNAWNEWAEGAHLEPDRRFGYGYLQATRDVVVRPPQAPKVVVVSHDAHPHGAQYLALNLVKEFQRIGCTVEVVLLGPGMLSERFEQCCATHRLYGSDAKSPEDLARELVGRGFDLVVANTAVSGHAAGKFHEAGAVVVSLVHELPGIIREYGLEGAVKELVRSADRIIAPSAPVAEGLRKTAPGEALERALAIRPQGLFTRSRYRSAADNSMARGALREKLHLPADSRIVLTVGYADRRKGVDLMVDVAGRLGNRRDDVHFVWVGHHDESIHHETVAALARNGMSDRFHFVGLDFDTDDYYAGADVYALASREDPFPSVVLESLSVGVPVIAFQGTGGAADLLERQGGKVVPAFDVDAYADAIDGLLQDDPARMALGEAGREAIDREFSFRTYAMDLLWHGGVAVPRVSVVVPNYNYAHYMRARLDSISAQTLPLYEVIVLDDCSTDDSIQVFRTLRGEMDPEPQLVVNSTNSGSVFRQWLRGVELARGDFVWIAEADDLCSPAFLERLLGPMLQDPSVVMAYCQSRQIDERGHVMADDYLAYTDDISKTRWRRAYVEDGAEEVGQGMAIKNVCPNVSAAVFRKDALLAVLREHIEEICSFRVAGDWIAYLHLLQRGKVAYVPEAGNSHRRHSSSVTLDFDKARHLDEIRRAQARARELFDLSTAVRGSQDAYAASVARQFGLGEQQAQGAR